MTNKSTSVSTQEIREAAHLDNLAATDVLGINAVALMLGLSQAYVRHAVRLGQLKTTKVPVSEGSKTIRHAITVADVEAWRTAHGTHAHREDGRRRFILYATDEELAKVRKLLEAQKIEAIIEKQVFKKHQPAGVVEEAEV
jgi:hypothetical protein